jgi:hypothetical protein
MSWIRKSCPVIATNQLLNVGARHGDIMANPHTSYSVMNNVCQKSDKRPNAINCELLMVELLWVIHSPGLRMDKVEGLGYNI